MSHHEHEENYQADARKNIMEFVKFSAQEHLHSLYAAAPGLTIASIGIIDFISKWQITQSGSLFVIGGGAVAGVGWGISRMATIERKARVLGEELQRMQDAENRLLAIHPKEDEHLRTGSSEQEKEK